MESILEKILLEKNKDLAQTRNSIAPEALEKNLEGLPPTRDFKTALRAKPPVIIAEIKRRSPSRGWIRFRVDPAKRAALYQKGGAGAVSVLTEERFFAGRPDFLRMAREAVNLPILRKDFILDPLQIYETRMLGADAVLLIARILGKRHLPQMIRLASKLGLEALVEVHTKDELKLALDAGAGIIGINNRNLEDFSTDLRRTLELAPLVPPWVTLVSESGISSRADLELLMQAGVGAFLMGEILMKARDPEKKLFELLHHRTKT